MTKKIRGTQPKWLYILAISLGLVIIFLPEIPSRELSVIFSGLAAGLLSGFIGPGNSWRWGLWIAAPAFLLIGLSVIFAGNVDMFLKNDLPVLMIILVSACAGSFAGAWSRHKLLPVS
jgi:hypothetical protein